MRTARSGFGLLPKWPVEVSERFASGGRLRCPRSGIIRYQLLGRPVDGDAPGAIGVVRAVDGDDRQGCWGGDRPTPRIPCFVAPKGLSSGHE